jgi:hypothetical protein
MQNNARIPSPWGLLVNLESVKIDEKIKLEVINLRKECKSYLESIQNLCEKWKPVDGTVTILSQDKNIFDDLTNKYYKKLARIEKLLLPWKGELKRWKTSN